MWALRSSLALTLLLFLSLASAATPALAQATSAQVLLAEATTSIAGWEKALREAERTLQKPENLDTELITATSRSLEKVANDAKALRSAVEAALSPIEAELRSLGPAPAEGAAPEEEKVAQSRDLLTRRQIELEGFASQASLSIVRAQNLLAELGAQERGQFTALVMTRLPAPLLPGVWVEGWQQMLVAIDDAVAAPEQWWRAVSREGDARIVLIGGGVLTGVALFLAWPLHAFLRRRWGPRPDIRDPSRARRVLAAGAMAVSDIILPCIVLVALSVLISSTAAGEGDFFVVLVNRVARDLMLFLLVSGLARATLSPHFPDWRVIPVTPVRARQLADRATLLTIVVVIFDLVYTSATRNGEPGGSFIACNTFLRDLALAAMILTLLRHEYWVAPDPRIAGVGTALRRVLLAIAVGSPMLSATGYAYLSEFVLMAVMSTIVVLSVAWLLRSILIEALAELSGSHTGDPRAAGEPGPAESVHLRFWARLLVEAMVWPPALYLLLLSYGFSPSLLNLILSRAMTGVTFGQVNLSLGEMVLALLLLVTGLFLVGRAKRWLSRHALPQTRFDIGLQNSIAAGFGYVGTLVVLTLSVVTLGIDLSNIAIIAGALSVGVGFGLRTIVENFVAGILILIERPIKVGDWISVGGTEGTVRRISVRSTEIETFDNASVILPNSELISNSVINWTLRDRVVRVVVNLRVVPGSDVRLVRDILLDCARRQRRVCAEPAPSVLFRKFVDIGLEFELRCFVVDSEYVNQVGSDLNFAIDAAFATHGIMIAHSAGVTRAQPEAAVSPPPALAPDTRKAGPIPAEE